MQAGKKQEEASTLSSQQQEQKAALTETLSRLHSEKELSRSGLTELKEKFAV